MEEALAGAKKAIDAIPTRAELEAKELPYTDVKEGAWYYQAVQYAVNQGLFQGTTESTFSPNGTMSRAMAVTVLYRLAGSPEVKALWTSRTWMQRRTTTGPWYGLGKLESSREWMRKDLLLSEGS